MRGRTIANLLMAASIAGTLAALIVPGYTRVTVRARRAELRNAFTRLRSHFAARYGEQDSYGADIADVQPNPPSAAPGRWDPAARGWNNVSVSLDGVRARYWYGISGGGKVLTLLATAELPGVGPYVYGETYEDGSLVLTTEMPGF